MVGALVVSVGIILVFVVAREVTRSDLPSPVRDVDYAKVADFARRQAPFDLVSPASLPHGWRATTVDYVDGEDARWHLGMLTDEEQYVGLEQTDSSTQSMLETYVDEDTARGEPVDIDGTRWSTWTDEGGDLALVRSESEAAVLVVGHRVPRDELVAFVRSLR